MKEIYKFKLKNGDKVEDFSFMEISKAVAREGEMVYAKEYAECVRNKLLTNAEALKLANERGGVFTDEEKDDYVKALAAYLSKDTELTKSKDNHSSDGSAEAITEKLQTEYDELKQKILGYQSKNEEIYTFTAESKSRDTVILHYALALVYKDGKAFFDGRDYPSRLKNVEAFSDFQQEVLKRGVWYSTAAFYGVPTDSKDVVYPQDRGLVSDDATPKVS